MKKVYSLILLLVVASLTVSAQAQIRVGLKAGLNLASVTEDYANGAPPLLRFHVGVLSEVDLSEKLYLRGELLYSVKGWGSSTNDFSMNLHYLSLPVLLAYRPTAKLSVLAGPEAGYRLMATPAMDFFDFHENLQKWDFGLIAGVSYAFTSRLGIELRYNHGVKALSEIELRSADGSILGTKSDGYNRSFQLGVFYFLDNPK